MNNQNTQLSYLIFNRLRYMLIATGIVLFFVIGGQMFMQVDSKQAVIGQSLDAAK